MIKKNWGMCFLFLSILFSIFLSCEGRSFEKREYLLGTQISIRLINQKLKPEQWEELFDISRSIHRTMGSHHPESEILQLTGRTQALVLSPDSYEVVERAMYFSYLTEGAFHVALLPLIKLWSVETGPKSPPPQHEIERLLNVTKLEDVVLNPQTREVFLTKKEMGIDLGGIAKGYAADKSAEWLRKTGIKNAILDFGGNIRTLGQKKKGQKWQIGVHNPFPEKSNPLAVISLEGSLSIVSSGAYERFFEFEGNRYHHIINSKTGYPSQSNLESVTVVSTEGMEADALSTAFFVMGLEESKIFIDKHNIRALLLTKNKELYVSPLLRDLVEIIDKTIEVRAWR